MSPTDLSALSHLSSAPSKTALAAILNRTVLYLPMQSPYPPPPVSAILSSFSLNANQQESLYLALRRFTSAVLAQHTPTSDTTGFVREILASHASGLDPKLVDLLSTVTPSLASPWRESAMQNKVSPPSLTTIDWRVSLPRSATNSSVTSGATLLLNLGVKDGEAEKKVPLELDKAGVDSLLDSLKKIKDQLNKVV
mmetsp:Transcript_2616/g.4965  ORF Transcript_2616/g.4965 Transcript_2616/m.4965 type:complete len:196 (-) Transcript_2616:39-626(-)|eukprot:CAMPEP_0182454414 /NCGR_PEP_ID=MMETSP1319-20130603/1064_1 /TAXON_ID=172717 /ORGANISM="Bolidomonas pacifica, Strain RCC208" /LENGTH=195 /DNA_ID=CAMNT_0024652427 /DNA_START=128 /DNA_END=718 /DNA_ORIENTATION=-